jgi:hypothetical protein
VNPHELLVAFPGSLAHRIPYGVVEPTVQVLADGYVTCVVDQPAVAISYGLGELLSYVLTTLAVDVADLGSLGSLALYAGDPSNGSATRVASFREGRIGYRLWAMRTGRINPSVEDRLDHDVDELLA